MSTQPSSTAAELDAEIHLLEERLHELKQKRNAISILYRYPLEIFEQIIRFVQVEDGDDAMRYSDSEWTGLNRKWGRAMLICRRFRDAALQCSSLWSVVDARVKSKLYHDLCLERAGTHDLDLLGVIKYDHDESTKRTLRLFKRASGIRLIIPSVDVVDPLTDGDIEHCIAEFKLRHMSCQQPNLKRLEIFNETENEIMYWFKLGLNFLGGNAISLTHLLIDGCELLDAPPLPTLRRLILRHVHMDHYCDDIRTILGHTTGLTFLRIDNPVSDPALPMNELLDTIQHITVKGPVDLPQLHTLQIVGELNQVARIMHISPNPTHNLTLHVQDPQDDGNMILIGLPEGAECARLIYLRALQYLRQQLSGLNPLVAGHQVELHRCDMAGTATLVTFSPIPSLDEHDQRHLRRLTLRLVCPTNEQSDLQIMEIVRYAETFVIPQSPRQLNELMHLITECRSIQSFTIGNAFHIDVSQESVTVKNLEQVVADRARKGSPLRRLEFKYVGSEQQHAMARLNEKREKMTMLAEVWKRAGLVTEVEHLRVWTQQDT